MLQAIVGAMLDKSLLPPLPTFTTHITYLGQPPHMSPHPATEGLFLRLGGRRDLSMPSPKPAVRLGMQLRELIGPVCLISWLQVGIQIGDLGTVV
jgi:hypothetical protein